MDSYELLVDESALVILSFDKLKVLGVEIVAIIGELDVKRGVLAHVVDLVDTDRIMHLLLFLKIVFHKECLDLMAAVVILVPVPHLEIVKIFTILSNDRARRSANCILDLIDESRVNLFKAI